MFKQIKYLLMRIMKIFLFFMIMSIGFSIIFFPISIVTRFDSTLSAYWLILFLPTGFTIITLCLTLFPFFELIDFDDWKSDCQKYYNKDINNKNPTTGIFI